MNTSVKMMLVGEQIAALREHLIPARVNKRIVCEILLGEEILVYENMASSVFIILQQNLYERGDIILFTEAVNEVVSKCLQLVSPAFKETVNQTEKCCAKIAHKRIYLANSLLKHVVAQPTRLMNGRKLGAQIENER